MTIEHEAADVMLAAARRVGEYLMRGYRSGVTIDTKSSDNDLLTEYDLGAERQICETIRARFPDHRIVAEEGAKNDGGEQSEWTWYVDPIDGTTNFAHGHPFFASSIALYQADKAALGIVHAPALGTTWLAVRDGKTMRNGKGCEVRTNTELSQALGATGFGYDRRERSGEYLKHVDTCLKHARGLRRCGAASLDLALVADGTYDFYWESSLQPWDVAAGILLVEQAGGVVESFKGGAAELSKGEVLAGNAELIANARTTFSF